MLPGERVRLKDDSSLRLHHPELADAVGVVSSVLDRNRMHVRFSSLNMVALHADADQFEVVDTIEPVLPSRSTTRLRVV